MAWIADHIWCHAKFVDLSDAGHRLYVNGVAYSSGFSTGGVLTAGMQRTIGATTKTRNELIAARLWDDRGETVYVHDWDEHNGKRDARRAADRERKRKLREDSAGQSAGTSAGQDAGASDGESAGAAHVDGSDGSDGFEGFTTGSSSNGLDVEIEHLIVRLLVTCGTSVDANTADVFRAYASKLSPASIAKVIETTTKKPVAQRARYANGALQREIEERKKEMPV